MSQVDVSVLEQFNDGSVNLESLNKLNLSSDEKDIHSSVNGEVYQFFSRKLLNFKAFRKSIEVLCEKFGCDLTSPEKNNIEDCQFLLYNFAVLEFHCGSYISCHKIISVLIEHEIGEQLKKNCYALLAECLLRMKRGEECVAVVDRYFSTKGRTNLRDQLGIGESNASRLELQLRIQKLRACMMEKKVTDAETILKELLDAEVESSLLSHLISNLEYLQNNFDVALSLIGQVSNVSSDYRQTGMSYSVIYLNNLGCLFYHLGKTHLAALHFQKALVENQALLKSLAESDTDDSLAKFPLPVISGNLYFEILYNLGTALLHSGKPKQAFACFQNCRLKYKEDPQLLLRLAECCIQAARPENEADFNLNEKKKNLVRGIVGCGSQRKLILNSSVSSLVQNLEKAPEGMDFVSGLKYIHTSIQLCNDILSGASTKGKNFLFGNRPGNPIGVQEILRLSHSSLIAGAFMALTMGEYEMTLKFCKDVPQENCSPAQSYLLKLYMAEALVMLSRPEEALPLLNPQNMTSVETSLPKEDGTLRKLPYAKTWYPNSVAVAKCVMQYNMAAALAIRGDLEKSAEIIRLLWIARGNGADIPTQVVALALYIEIKRGNYEIARNIVKYQFPSLK